MDRISLQTLLKKPHTLRHPPGYFRNQRKWLKLKTTDLETTVQLKGIKGRSYLKGNMRKHKRDMSENSEVPK